jgi:hypothetical protein
LLRTLCMPNAIGVSVCDNDGARKQLQWQRPYFAAQPPMSHVCRHAMARRKFCADGAAKRIPGVAMQAAPWFCSKCDGLSKEVPAERRQNGERCVHRNILFLSLPTRQHAKRMCPWCLLGTIGGSQSHAASRSVGCLSPPLRSGTIDR